MRIIQNDIGGEKRVALLDDSNRPIRFYIWRDQELNVGDVVNAKIVQKNGLLRGYFAQTSNGQSIFIPTQEPYTNGQSISVQITKESRLGKDANGIVTSLTPANAPNIAMVLSKQLNTPIEDQWDELNLDEALLETLDPIVSFKSGLLRIERTSVCWTIDVDSGNSTAPLTETNTDALVEIARQIVLRNLSGMILIDFAGFKHRGEKVLLEQRLKKALEQDDLSQVLGFTHSGLFEIRRKRVYASVQDRLCGNGTQLSALSIAYIIERKLKKVKGAVPSVIAHPAVLTYFKPKLNAGIKLISDLNRPTDSFEIKE